MQVILDITSSIRPPIRVQSHVEPDGLHLFLVKSIVGAPSLRDREGVEILPNLSSEMGSSYVFNGRILGPEALDRDVEDETVDPVWTFDVKLGVIHYKIGIFRRSGRWFLEVYRGAVGVEVSLPNYNPWAVAGMDRYDREDVC